MDSTLVRFANISRIPVGTGFGPSPPLADASQGGYTPPASPSKDVRCEPDSSCTRLGKPRSNQGYCSAHPPSAREGVMAMDFTGRMAVGPPTWPGARWPPAHHFIVILIIIIRQQTKTQMPTQAQTRTWSFTGDLRDPLSWN